MPRTLLDRALREAVDETFNAITVDGECSTNDCVMILANGASGVTIDNEEGYLLFVGALKRVCRELALGDRSRRRRRDQAGDGQGHGRGVQRGGAACSQGDRQFAARQDGGPRRRSELGPAHRRSRTGERRVRTVAGGGLDRIDCALSRRQPYDEAAPLAAEYLKNTEIELAVDLGAGQASSTVWTCDLSAEYVRINADYRT